MYFYYGLNVQFMMCMRLFASLVDVCE